MSASIPAAGKKFDILVYGATGFTGKLVAAYLDKALELGGPGKNWAIAGRSEDKLRTVGDALTTNPPGIVSCDLADKDAVEKMVASSRVVLNCAGPYSTQNAEALLGACAKQGKHYSDLSGETFWQHEMVVAYHDIAAKSGAKIVLGGGVDSIPSDLGTFLALKQLKALGSEEVHVTGVYTEYTGSISGGTLASSKAIRAAYRSGRISKEMAFSPYILAPGTTGLDSKVNTLSGFPRKFKRQFDLRFGMLLDFFMAPINAPVVRRSLALQDRAATVSYRECTSIGMWARLLWTWLSRGLGYLVGEPINLKPKPGQGPPKWLMACGGYTVHITAVSKSVTAKAKVSGRGDPGYRATSKMFAELGLCLAFDLDGQKKLENGPSHDGGVLTPSTALGDVLVQRLAAAEGGKFMKLTCTAS